MYNNNTKVVTIRIKSVGGERGVWVFQCFNVLIFLFLLSIFFSLTPHVNFFLSKKTWGDFFLPSFFFGLARGESCLLFRKIFSLLPPVFLLFSCKIISLEEGNNNKDKNNGVNEFFVECKQNNGVWMLEHQLIF